MAVFGSSPDVIDASVSSVCSALHIPYLSTGGLGTNVAPSNGQFVVRVGPQARDLVNAVEKLVKKLEWTEVAYIVHRKTGTRPVSRFRIERSCDFAASELINQEMVRETSAISGMRLCKFARK